MSSSSGMKNFKYIAFWSGWLSHRNQTVVLAWALSCREAEPPGSRAEQPGWERMAPLTEQPQLLSGRVLGREMKGNGGKTMGVRIYVETRRDSDLSLVLWVTEESTLPGPAAISFLSKSHARELVSCPSSSVTCVSSRLATAAVFRMGCIGPLYFWWSDLRCFL
jgi:hypothetical protein